MGDAFTVGVEPGGLNNRQEIRILVCYMLDGAGEPMPRQSVLDIISGQGMANFFETGAAVSELIERGHLSEDGELLEITDTGRQIAGSLAQAIPLTLRERSIKAALSLLTRIRRERENTVTIERLPHGCVVTCTINDADAPLMSLSLKVADHLQAQLIREKFLDDPILFYQSAMSVLTGNAVFTHDRTRIAIELQ